MGASEGHLDIKSAEVGCQLIGSAVHCRVKQRATLPLSGATPTSTPTYVAPSSGEDADWQYFVSLNHPRSPSSPRINI
eukprot:442509-Rhodomonas_salina.5